MNSYRILLIDDDDLVLQSLKAGLEDARQIVTTAPGGDAGIAALEQNEFDIVVSDIVMENGEGIETLRRIRSIWPNLPVIGISGNPAYLNMFETLGGNASLAKPFRTKTLVEQIFKVLTNPSRTVQPRSFDNRTVRNC